jgi:hypothetical protein
MAEQHVEPSAGSALRIETSGDGAQKGVAAPARDRSGDVKQQFELLIGERHRVALQEVNDLAVDGNISKAGITRELAALEPRMITIPATLALEHVEEPQADGGIDAGQDGGGCVDDEASGDDT